MQFCFGCGTQCAKLIHTSMSTLCEGCSTAKREPASEVVLPRVALFDNLMFA
jgi:hypothetical protein